MSAKASSSGGGTCWLATNGLFVWTFNTISGNIGALKIASGGGLTAIGSVALSSDIAFPLDLALAGGNQYLYVLFSNIGKLIGYKVDDNGALTAVTSIAAGQPASGKEAWRYINRH